MKSFAALALAKVFYLNAPVKIKARSLPKFRQWL